MGSVDAKDCKEEPTMAVCGHGEEDATAAAEEQRTDLSLSEVGLIEGGRLEVAWEVECTDGTSETVWWGGCVQRAACGTLEVQYDPDHGFEEETRKVAFCSRSELRDLVLDESLPWRLPGAGDDEEDSEDEATEATADTKKRAREELVLEPGTLVKARLDGSGRSFSASIEQVNEDGTLDLACDGSLVQGVPADLVEAVALESNVADALDRGGEGDHINGTNAFFDAFTAALTSGPTFQRLSAHQKAVASEKVRALRPFFEEELTKIRAERGEGATVTDADIQAMLPRVMARSKED
mgnify:CR=1 FL=1